MNEQNNMGISKLSKDILALICKVHKGGGKVISFDGICESLKKNRDRYRKIGVENALSDLYQKGFVYRRGDGYSLKPIMGQVTC